MKQVDLLIHSARELLTCSSPAGPKRGRAMSDVGKVVLASVIAAAPTIATRMLMRDVSPLVVLITGGFVFYAAFIAAGFWLRLPTAAEKDFLNMWYRRIPRLGAPR